MHKQVLDTMNASWISEGRKQPMTEELRLKEGSE